MKAITLFVLVLSFWVTAGAQPNPDTLWTLAYGGQYWDEPFSVQQTADGGYVVVGYTGSFGAGAADFYLLKTNGSGEPLWDHTYGGAFNDFAKAVLQTGDGGYVIAGSSTSYGPTFASQMYLVKTNSLGDTLWTRTYGGEFQEEAYSVIESGGGYVMAGYSTSFSDSYDFYLVKTNSLGDTVWTRTYGGEGTDWAYSVRQAIDGGYIIAGYTNSSGAGGSDFYLVKTDSEGNQEWAYTYGGLYGEWAYSVLQTSDEGYIVAGVTETFGEDANNFFLVKMNSQGDSLWSQTYGVVNSGDEAYSIAETADGGYIIAGYTWSHSGGGTQDFCLVRTNSQGDALWTQSYGGGGSDKCRSVRQTSDGGYIAAGTTESFGAGLGDFYLVKTVPDALDSDPVRSGMPEQYTLDPNFPNPFNASTQIVYSLPTTGRVTLKVFNLLGEEITNLADGIQTAGTYTVSFDGTGLASGVYFYRLQSDGFAQSRKMVLLK